MLSSGISFLRFDKTLMASPIELNLNDDSYPPNSG